MAKEIDKIIQSKTPPKNNNVLWYNGENLKVNRNGKWENVVASSSGGAGNIIIREDIGEPIFRENGQSYFSKEQIERTTGCTLKEIFRKVSDGALIIFMYYIPIYIYMPEGSMIAYLLGTDGSIYMFMLSEEEIELELEGTLLKVCAIFGKSGAIKVPPSDWSARSDEEGYILNRTHYVVNTEDLGSITVNFTNEPQVIAQFENGETGYFTVSGKDVLPGKDLTLQGMGSYQLFYIKDNKLYATSSSSSAVSRTFIIQKHTIKQLPEKYIPATIARSSELKVLEDRIAALEAKLNS